ncbi:hypothetical protein THAOC_05110 [Thalassiosira oceanica]|uniref:Uncharacterized protein n=1 Tax=Thalassiosira oceanica TaxID=159749 RepID=K0T6J5_THAOC|nr:hypothetical protein THAOC_05110 [Thalassiosira oceanica]|mmetsp:Transcript_37273/g.89237  ORF Transcript_37273/g.89237 Transcript_37273/m.89237 type:complete len:277 (-) Transcript_37273:94-924(-)|eukprot:EJK73275.1 hypothetical protein THAOC_05110 [Thalassiosira oceanica]
MIKLVAALAVVCFAFETSSFTVAWNGKKRNNILSTAKRASADDDATLNLYGEFEYKSKTAPYSPRIVDFLSLDETPRILLRGTGKNEVARVKEVDDALNLRYEALCRDLGLTADNASDRGYCTYYEVRTGGVRFPGLQVDSLATIGVRQLTDGYEFVLVGDTTEATGIPLFVYFFNRVTGKAEISDDDASSAEQTTTSVNRISYSVLDERVQFTSKANLSIRLGFPRVILKILPGARTKKIEEKGGEALVSALEKDIPTALENLVDKYVKWLQANE